VSDQNAKIKSLFEESQRSASELLSERITRRPHVDPQNWPHFDQETRRQIKDEGSQFKEDFAKITGVRDDVLDTIGGERQDNSHFHSQLMEAIRSVETSDASTKREYNNFIDTILNSIPELESPSESSDNSNFDSDSYSGSESDIEKKAEKNPSLGVTGAPSSDPIPGPSSGATTVSSNKRKADEADLDEGDSALDYVLKKQQSEPFDPTDDID
jgi:hypothetical protein